MLRKNTATQFQANQIGGYPEFAVTQCMQTLSLKFKTLNEAKWHSGQLSTFCPHPNRALIGLTELFVNAIEHGNLAISSEEKAFHLEKGTWLDRCSQSRQSLRCSLRNLFYDSIG